MYSFFENLFSRTWICDVEGSITRKASLENKYFINKIFYPEGEDHKSEVPSLYIWIIHKHRQPFTLHRKQISRWLENIQEQGIGRDGNTGTVFLVDLWQNKASKGLT